MIGRHVSELDTPCLVVDIQRLDRNIRDVQARVSAAGLALRPHAKAHKIAEITRRQIAGGAVGVTTAKLSEAEALVARGVTDVLVCYPLVGPAKLDRLLALTRRARVLSVVDSVSAARAIAERFVRAGETHEVLVKIDAGFGRIGVTGGAAGELAENSRQLVETIADLDGISFSGLCIHEGSTYGVVDPELRHRMAADQCATLVHVARTLERLGTDVPVVSAGSTPGLAGDLTVAGITEVRPGNYVFYDAIQVGLGVAELDQCALTVLTTVVSNTQTPRFVVDGGSKVFGLDRGAHGLAVTEGYGTCLSDSALRLTGLSEEHGWGAATAGGVTPSVGDVLRFVPNHACSVVNNVDAVWVADGDLVVDTWDVCARGAVT